MLGTGSSTRGSLHSIAAHETPESGMGGEAAWPGVVTLRRGQVRHMAGWAIYCALQYW